ncbi:MAG: hypothetical protein JSW60_04990 [Thermoplasmatales archaeon]|nr:MAG: hypothetical protein JSW60_04990 [Thermoplasmatales archaeon]
MNKKALVISSLAVVIIVLASLNPVVGTNIVKSDASIVSPLFAVRTQRSSYEGAIKKVDANYLGKGNIMSLFFSKKTSLQSEIDRAIKIINARPQILPMMMDKIALMPEIVALLKENDITINEFKSQMHQLINNPALLKEKIDEAVSITGDEPLPLGLSTSNPLGCFIVFLVLAPIFALIGVIIATITIITCIAPDCLENVVYSILENFLQGLTPPDYS